MASKYGQQFLDEISRSEGADYNTIVGGGTFSDYSQHPRVVGMVTQAGPSTAAGRYQITASTAESLRRKYPGRFLGGFTPDVQDDMANTLIDEVPGAREAINMGDFVKAKRMLSRIWSSFANSGTVRRAQANPAPEPGSSSTPLSWLYSPVVKDREAEVAQEQSAMNLAVGAPLNLPRASVLPNRSAAAVAFPSLLSNLASALSGNPLYQQQFMGELNQEDQQREQDLAENRKLSSDEILQRRAENLQNISGRLQYAQQRLEQAGNYEQAIALAERRAAIDKQMADDRLATEERIAQGRVDATIQAALLKAGLRMDTAEDGTISFTRIGAAEKDLTRKDRLDAMSAAIDAMSKAKTEGERAPIRSHLVYLASQRDTEDPDFQSYAERMKRDLPQYSPALAKDPTALRAMISSKALENMGTMPGATEAYKAFWSEAHPGAPKLSAGDAITEDDQATMGKDWTPKAPPEAPEVTKAKAVVQKAQGAKTLPSGEHAANEQIRAAQMDIDRYEEMAKTNWSPDVIDLLAKSYKRLEKAKKDLETIRHKGKTPEKKQ